MFTEFKMINLQKKLVIQVFIQYKIKITYLFQKKGSPLHLK